MVDISLWQILVPLIVSILTAVGALVAVIVNAQKTRAETKALSKALGSKQEQLHQGQQKVLAQFQNNGGSTMKDSTDEIKSLIRDTQQDLRGIRRDIGRLSEIDMEDRQRAVREHERFYTVLSDLKKDLEEHIDDVPKVLKKHQEETLKLLEEQNHESEQ